MLTRLRQSKAAKIAGFGILIVLVSAYAITWSLSYRYCQADYAAEHGQAYKSDFYEKIFTFAVCEGMTVDANGELITAIGTIVIALFTATLWRSTDRAGEHFRVTERAYVKMSHFSPGVTFVQNMGAWHAVLSIRVKNFGHTPAHITDVYVGSLVVTPAGGGLAEIPEYPPIEGREIAAAFLVADDEFIHHVDFGLTHPDHAAIVSGASDLYVLGYVDYRDKFGQTHRGTYARLYDREIDEPPANVLAVEAFQNRNNLTIASEPRYNDDFPIN